MLPTVKFVFIYAVLHSVTAMGVLAEGAGAGCIVGLLHAIAETTLLGSNSIRPSEFDLAIIVAASVAVGLFLGVVAALLALLPPLRKVLANNLPAYRQAVWGIVFCGYFLVFLKLVGYWSGWWTALRLSFPLIPVLTLAVFALLKRAHRPRVLLCAAALMAFSLCALHLASAEWGHLGVSSGEFAMRLLSPVLVCLAVFAIAAKSSSTHKQFESLLRTMAPLAILLIIWAGLWTAVFLEFSLSDVLHSAPTSVRASRPNILLIVLDTVRADHMDLFGYQRETMPNLKRFAQEECQSANRMITASSWTLPSHASMFTGLYPSAHGAHYPSVSDKLPGPSFLAYSLRDDTPTVAEFLGASGYQTAGIAANFAMLSHFGLPRGFQHYDVAPGASFFASRLLWVYRLRIGNWSSLGEWVRNVLPARWMGGSRMFSVREPDYRRAHEINSRARDWLHGHGDQPFFLFLNYMDAHDPYLPIAQDDERFVKRPPGEEWRGFPMARYREAVRGLGKFSAQEIEFMQGQYDAGLVSLDRELGRLFEYLKKSGFFENTLVLITVDHGEAFFEHGFPEHGNSVYQPEVGGFLLLKAPPSLGKIEVSPVMQSVDFFPTFAEVIGKPVPAPVQGSAWGKGRDHSFSEVFCKTCGCGSFGVEWPESLRHDLLAVVIGDQKLIRSSKEPDRVYKISSDPGEANPLTSPDQEFLRQAEAAIAERNSRASRKPNPVTPQDDALIERLRSLGYVK